MSPHVLDALRLPLEEGEVRIARSRGMVRYPARFQLVLAANPCPCGAARPVDCACAPTVRRRYAHRISGPLADRIDVTVHLHPVDPVLLASGPVESTAVVRSRVEEARRRAARRLAPLGVRLNSEVPGPVLRRELRPARDSLALLEDGVRRGELSGRGADRALRVAWTLADLAGHDRPGGAEVAAALTLREAA